MPHTQYYCIVLIAKDCFLIGRESYLAKNWQVSRDWMKEALTKYDEGIDILFFPLSVIFFSLYVIFAGSDSDIDLPLVYDHLAFSEYQLGNMKKATQYNRDLLQNGIVHYAHAMQ